MQKSRKFRSYSPNLMDYTQEQIEKKLSDVVPHGMREEIAKGTGIYPKIVDGYFNPQDERKSPHFTVLHIQSVLDNRSPDVGEAVWQTLCALREAGKPMELRTGRDIAETLTDKITNDASTTTLLIDAIKDGRVDVREAAKIQVAIRRERDNLDELEKLTGGELVH